MLESNNPPKIFSGKQQKRNTERLLLALTFGLLLFAGVPFVSGAEILDGQTGYNISTGGLNRYFIDPQNATDGSGTTYALTNNNFVAPDSAYIMWDFGTARNVTHVSADTTGGGTGAGGYLAVQGSDDNTTWVNVTNYGATAPNPVDGTAVTANYRYYRFFIQGGAASVGIALQYVKLNGSEAPGVTPNSTLTIRINDTVTGNYITGFCINATGTNTTQNLCNTTGTTITFQTTGTYNISFYNMSYFNTTLQNFNFNETKNATGQTYQALLNVSVYKLFLNTSISSYNITNNKITNTTTTTYLLIPASNGTNNIMASVAGNYTKNTTCTVSQPYTTTQCNVTGVYDSLYTIGARVVGGGSIQNFSVTAENTTLTTTTQNTTTHSVQFPLLIGYYYNFYMQAPGYAYTNTSQLVSASTGLYNFSLYTRNSMNITFTDEETGQVLNNNTVYLEIISTAFSGNYSTTNGRLYIDLLSPEEYVLRYTSSGYLTRFFEFTLVNNTYNEINLSLLSTTTGTNVTIYVYDDARKPVENAVVKVLKYNIATNTYVVNQIQSTNFEGRTSASIESNNEYYKFIVEYDGEVLLTTSPTYVYGNTLTFTISLNNINIDTYLTVRSLQGNITYNQNSHVATFTFNDPDNVATSGCVYAYKIYAQTTTLYNSSCASTSTGTVFVTLQNDTRYYYNLKGIVTKAGTQYTVATHTVGFNDSVPETNAKTGLFLTLLFMIVGVFITRYSLEGALLFEGTFLILLSVLGFNAISTPISIGIGLLCFVGAGIVSWRGSQ